MPNPHGRRRAPAYNRGNPRRSSGAGTAPRTPKAEPRSELDLALAAAARLPQPPATTFGELGLDPRIVRALAAQDITMPFAIQARALPDALAGRDVLRPDEARAG